MRPDRLGQWVAGKPPFDFLCLPRAAVRAARECILPLVSLLQARNPAHAHGILTVYFEGNRIALRFATIVGRGTGVTAGVKPSNTLQHQRPSRDDDTGGDVLRDR